MVREKKHLGFLGKQAKKWIKKTCYYYLLNVLLFQKAVLFISYLILFLIE